MVNSHKHYSSSFSDVLAVCILSAVLLRMMVDRGGEAPGEREIFSVCGPHRLNGGLHWLFV